MKYTYMLSDFIMSDCVFVVKGWIHGCGQRERKVLLVDKVETETVCEKMIQYILESESDSPCGFSKLLKENKTVYSSWKVTIFQGASWRAYADTIEEAQRLIKNEFNPLYG